MTLKNAIIAAALILLASVGLAHPASRLANEASPYLRQHVNDLVDWHVWGAEALEKSERLNKPIYLSIGYSACHWCHVMQKESFKNETIAKILNEAFIPILVDRERRPDLDETYMLATEAMAGHGGWPNNLILTPEQKPIFGAVYIPPDQLTNLLNAVRADWVSNEEELRTEADRVATLLGQFLNRKLEAAELKPEILSEAAAALVAQFDELNGGFGTAPKYLRATVLDFLLGEYRASKNAPALEAVETTLAAFASGGIHDHLDGGFHRYAVDPAWRVPHFEKMLYDQALATIVYVEAFQLTGKPAYEHITRKTLDYVLEDMTSPKGGFYSTRDADTEDEEGAYYVWTEEELRQVLGAEDGKFATELFEVVSEGELEGKIVINLDAAEPEMDKKIKSIFAKLWDERKKRSAPARDEKVIASWNGLMISAFAKASMALLDDAYRDAAITGALFLWNNLYDQKSGKLHRIWFSGKPSVDATLNDYAYAANALIDVYDLTGDWEWLERAEGLAEQMHKLFGDTETGDYYMTASRSGFARVKLRTDSDIPSGNSVALGVNAKLARRSLNPEFGYRADAAVAALSGFALSDVLGGAAILQAAREYLYGQSGLLQYAARGVVRAKASIVPESRILRVNLNIKPGWHINAHKPLEEDFIATSLALDAEEGADIKIKYPKAVLRNLGFHDEEMALYENEVQITAKLPEGAAVSKATLEIQACSDKLCLQPETLTFAVKQQAEKKE
ncbi:MAG: DUF255 domain-containing protein [Hyphomicrobiales bacterium]